MSRPIKRRRVCGLPACCRFGPLDGLRPPLAPVVLTVDEYECIRLIDYNRLTQADCAMQMAVARTTVQGIYDGARRKLALALVEGRMIQIEGGRYQLCEATSGRCRRLYKSACPRQASGKRCQAELSDIKEMDMDKIAVAAEKDQVSAHFGHCSQFHIFTVSDRQITGAAVVPNRAQACQSLPEYLARQGVTVIISGGMGAGARQGLTAQGFTVITGASGPARLAAEQYLNGHLQDLDAGCSQHEHADGSAGQMRPASD
ncbi:DUF134 domain-containing protein [Oscillospiraceae bacterium HV4-5-C5C]|nr:DUF134 domain-containing protein [Oscillospiraceae bacterium HV4-5-C5C]